MTGTSLAEASSCEQSLFAVHRSHGPRKWALPRTGNPAPATDVGSKIGPGLEYFFGNSLGGHRRRKTRVGQSAHHAAGFIDCVGRAGTGSIAVRISVRLDGPRRSEHVTIDPAGSARVKQVVDYAIGNGMYVVLKTRNLGTMAGSEDHPVFSPRTGR